MFLKTVVHFFESIPTEKINRYTTYILVIVLWAPHGAKECVNDACTGPNFVAPMIMTFLMPGWLMDMSLSGWLVQIAFAPPLFALIYALFYSAQKKRGKLLNIYAVRWMIMWFGILLYYNVVFWYGMLREYTFPLFVF